MRITSFTPHLIAIAAFGTLAAISTAADDSVWINQGISDAIAQGKTSYSLPAGTYTLSSPIVIPNGAKNFSLLGAGSSQTLLRTNNAMPYPGQAIQVGPGIISNWPMTSWQTSNLGLVKEGVTSISIPAGQPMPTVGKAFLYDDFGLVKSDGTGGIVCRGEPIKITVANSVSRTVTLDKPVGRDYSLSPKLSMGEVNACENIAVSGFGFDGHALNGEYSNGLLYASGTFGLSISDLKVTNYVTRAIETYMVRDAVIDGCLTEGAVAGGPGNGYGICVGRSRYVTVKNSTTNDGRHGVILHAGSMDVLVDSCNGSTGPDLHGFDERRVTFRNLSNPSGTDIGNDGWIAGAKDVLIDSCNFGEGNLWVHPRVRNLMVKNTTAGYVRFFWVPSAQNLSNLPGDGYAESAYFQNCVFSQANCNQLGNDSQVGTATFVNCQFIQPESNTGASVIYSVNAKGTFTFTGCNFVQYAWNSSAPIYISGSKGAKFTFLKCKIDPRNGRSAYGFQFATDLAARVSISSSTVYESPNRLKSTFTSGANKYVSGLSNTWVSASGAISAIKL